ncbi:MAG: ATPase [Planctomycetes bacterium]|nr:ATPase [Planctomycetota bacterium]
MIINTSGKKTWDRLRRSPFFMVLVWFGGFILFGTALLLLPIAHVEPGVSLDFLSALFTAVSAGCVTGLTVVNVGDTFSTFGQVVIFLLMELGGMGIMTFASLGFRLIGRRLSLSQHSATADAIYQSDAAHEFRRTFTQILRVVLSIQAIGAIVMAFALIPRHWLHGDGWEKAFMIWSAIFHSVSAFCNSGFTLYSDGLASLYNNWLFLIAILVLVTLGGLGHLVLNELYRLPRYMQHHEKKPHWLSLHTKVVLIMTAILITIGVVCIWSLGTVEEGSSLWHAIFETVNGRTAGFSIISQSRLPLPSLIVLMFLMFVGGSPGSCAGGIKTTSLAIWIARIRANLRNDSNVNLFGYTIAPELVSRARILMALTMIWNLVGVFLLAVEHPLEDLQTLFFEQISAFGTVGLTMDFTERLTSFSRIWIILSMFVGRLGPLTIALWMTPSARSNIGRPIGRVMVG